MHHAIPMHHLRIETPVGELLLIASDSGLSYVAFSDENHAAITLDSRPGDTPILEQARRELEQYFAGERTEFTVPRDWCKADSASFRREVQRFLLTIGFGESRTYKEVAREIGNPGAVRAVGSACATNPLPIFVPCHRVRRSDGTLGGYRGGLEAKEWLLSFESNRK